MKMLLLIGSCLLAFSHCAEVIENVNEQNSTEKDIRESSASTLSSSNTTSYAGPRNQDIQRIIEPVIITSPQLDKHLHNKKNFTGSPMLGPIYSPREEFNHQHYHQVAQRQRQQQQQQYHHHQQQKQPNTHQFSSKEVDFPSKEQQYSQPLHPDFFYTQQYLRTQQQKELEDYRNRPAVFPQAKNNGYGKPVKFDDPDYTYTLTETKDISSSPGMSSSQPPSGSGSPHPYSFVSSSEWDMEPPPLTETLSSKLTPSSSWTQGYQAGVTKKQEENTGMWKKMMNLLTAFIPLGLFLAAIPPNVLTINTTQPNVPSRQRSLDNVTFPIFDLLDKYGVDSLDDEECENRIFCEVSRMGRLSDATFIYRAFWQLAHDTPDKTAEAMGMRELFKAVRTGACDYYKCNEKRQVEETQATNTEEVHK